MAALIKVFDPVLGWMARRYQAAVAQELKNYGLRYEDLFDPMMNLVRRCTEKSALLPPSRGRSSMASVHNHRRRPSPLLAESQTSSACVAGYE